MKVSILCTDPAHPVNRFLEEWIAHNSVRHQISLFRNREDLPGGNLLFLVSCSEILRRVDRAKYDSSLVLHASDLPAGRGWSPHIWAIISGADSVTLSLLEAEDQVDSGRIWKKVTVAIPRHALWYEINERLFRAEIDLMDFAVQNFDSVKPLDQAPLGDGVSLRRRTHEDSRIEPSSTLEEQFDRIRVCDPMRFPAFFELRGHRYKLILEKLDDEPDND
jgi:methionyl-tRNA formyltransferase